MDNDSRKGQWDDDDGRNCRQRQMTGTQKRPLPTKTVGKVRHHPHPLVSSPLNTVGGLAKVSITSVGYEDAVSLRKNNANVSVLKVC